MNAKISIAHVGNRSVTQHSTDLTREEARARYVQCDAKHKRVSRHDGAETTIFYWIDRAEGNLPGVGTHIRLYVPTAWLKV